MAPELRPRRSKAAAPTEAAIVETPKPKPKTPKASKRKATEDVSPAAKKQKSVKTPSKATPETKQKDAEKTPASESTKDETHAKKEAPAKETPAKDAGQPTINSKKKTPAKPSSQNTPQEAQEILDSKVKVEKTVKKTPKATKKSVKKIEPAPEPEPEQEPEPIYEEAAEKKGDEAASPEENEQNSSEEELDEETKALVQVVDNVDEDEPESGVVLFEQGGDVGKIPEVSEKEKKKAKKALAASKAKEDTGVIYIGRLPHGFYEHEMKSYFSQFGPIRNLRVSRNKITGKAKHYAFVEFEEASTAEIVAKTMDNYLLFGHILKCSVIPKKQVHDDLFKGANKRFKPIPRNKMEGKQMERPQLENKWERRITKEKKRRADRAKKLEALGYDFDAPQIKPVANAKAITAPEALQEESPKAIEAESEAASAIEAPSASEKVEKAGATEQDDEELESTPKPVKRSRGRPTKTPQKKVAETPRKTPRRKA